MDCYPIFIKLHDCMLHTINNGLFGSEINYRNLFKRSTGLAGLLGLDLEKDYFEEAFKIYQEKNFANEKDIYGEHIKRECNLKCSDEMNCPLKIYDETGIHDLNIIKIKGVRKDRIKVGILNTNTSYNNFERRILEKPNLYSKRFDRIKMLINESIDKNVDLLLMPEMYIPYEWIEKIVRISKDQQMAMILGVEPVDYKNKIGNYMMMTLPFIFDDKYKECVIIHRLKNHYSPEEVMQLEKYEKKIKGEDNTIPKYYMCIWNDVHIVPYFVYEFESVEDRCIFKSCYDMITISGFDKDNEYSNGMAESLSRDLFCYCVKSNYLENGGSSIIQPTSSIDKYIINLKGGKEDYIVTYDLNIKELRETAIRFDKIENSSDFEPKPPGFCKNNVKWGYKTIH